MKKETYFHTLYKVLRKLPENVFSDGRGQTVCHNSGGQGGQKLYLQPDGDDGEQMGEPLVDGKRDGDEDHHRKIRHQRIR